MNRLNHKGYILLLLCAFCILGATAGSSDDWAKGDLNIKFSYTMELRDTGFFGFLLPEELINDNYQEVFDGLSAMSEEMNRRWPMPGKTQ